MKRFSRWIIPFIFLLHIILHLHNYANEPPRGATSDEYTYAFLGLSLIQRGVPTSWSYFPDYQNPENMTIRGINFPIVSPYFDHPPLVGLLVGGVSYLAGERTFETVNLATIRLVPIALSIVTLALILTLGRLLYDEATARWAMLIFATTPLFVMNTRVVFAESLLAVFFLLALILSVRARKRMTTTQEKSLGIVSALSFWTKISGVTVGLSLLVLGIYERITPKRLATIALLLFFAMVLYVGYGALYDAELFFKITKAQASRAIGPETLFLILTNPVIVDKVTIEGFYAFGFFALAFLTVSDFRKNNTIVIPALTYFLFLLETLTKVGFSGWYMIPLYPFMALASAKVLRDGMTRNGWILIPFVLLVGFPYIQRLEVSFGLTVLSYRLMLAIVLLPVLTVLILKKNALIQKLGQTLFALSIIANAVATYTYTHPV